MRSRRVANFTWLAFCYALMGVLLGSCADEKPPDYQDPAAVAEALNAGGIRCLYSTTAPAEARLFDAESTGRCEGSDFAALIFVFTTPAERAEREQAARDHWCNHGISTGSYVSAGRWLVTLDAPPTDDPDAVYMEDVAAATGGERAPQRCS